MRHSGSSDIKNKLVPYLLFPMLIGILTGIVIFLFKVASSSIMRQSERIYAFVRQNPIYLPLIIVCAALIGVICSFVLKVAKECQGGGIPTAIASIRGLIPLKWIQGTFILFGSALMTYLVGVPLGNEGPSVQMGAAVGEGGANLAGKKKLAWERYLMTGGACSGFAIATGAPFSGIIFGLEEAHRRFSTSLFMVASISVLFGTVTQDFLSSVFGVDTTFFDISVSQNLPVKYLWAATIIGVGCGLCSLLFTRLYRTVKKLSKRKLARVSFTVKLTVIFAVTALCGFLSASFIGTGHSLIHSLLHGRMLWYSVVLALIVRAILMICANNEGVSGGLFVPNLAFGAMIASLISDALISLGLVEDVYYSILVIVGMASFLAASSRTPITAITFAAETLCVASNIFPVILGVAVSYIIAEILGKTSFIETVIESRADAFRNNKDAIIVDDHMTVQKGSFACGMEVRNILWPPTCTVLSIDRNQSHTTHHSTQEIREGDILHLHYQTYDPAKTRKMLTAILGDQPYDQQMSAHLGSDDHLVPFD